MNTLFCVGFDRTPNQSVPDKRRQHDIQEKTITNLYKVSKDNIKSFISFIGEQGSTFSPGTFDFSFYDIGANRDYFKQMQLFVLDFDNSITFNEVKKRADLYEIPILFAVETIESTDQSHFRVAFLNDVSITDLKVTEIILEALIIIFPEASAESKDITRICFGGKNVLYLDKSAPQMNIESLIRNMTLYLKDSRGDTKYKKHLSRFAHRTGIGLTEDKLLNIQMLYDLDKSEIDLISGKISPQSTITEKIIVGSGENLPNKMYLIWFNQLRNNTIDPSVKKNSKNFHRSGFLNNVRQKCQLFRDFESNDRKLNDNELFGLGTNINKIESGAKRFRKILEKHKYFDEQQKKYSDWSFYLSYTKNYMSMPCDYYCPYKDKCQHDIDIRKTSKPSLQEITRISNYKESFVTLSEAEKDFELHFMKAITSTERIWHIIKAQTALGKTTTYLKFLKNTHLKILIVVPTIILKNEVYKKAIKEFGIDNITKSPSIEEYKLTDDLNNYIKHLRKIGKPTNPFLKKKIKENHPCSKILEKYLKKQSDFLNPMGMELQLTEDCSLWMKKH